MTTSDEAFNAFKELFTPESGIIGRMTALNAGVELVHSLASEAPVDKDPQIVAAEIMAIGTMVGQYVNALVQVDFADFARLKIDGVYGKSFPSKLEVDVRMSPPEDPTSPTSDQPE